MKKGTNEQNENGKNINHLILSWCSRHKMKLAIIVILLGIGLVWAGHRYQVQQGQYPHLTMDISWDATEGGFMVLHQQDPTVEISHTQEAKLVVTTHTSREGTIKITVYSPDEAIKMYDWDNNIMKIPCVVRTLYVPRGKQPEIGMVRFKAPIRPTYYGITVCATLDDQCETCKNAYFSVVNEGSHAVTQIQKSAATPIQNSEYQKIHYSLPAIIFVVGILTASAIFFVLTKRKIINQD